MPFASSVFLAKLRKQPTRLHFAPESPWLLFYSTTLDHFRPQLYRKPGACPTKKLNGWKNFYVESGGKLWKVWLSVGKYPTDGVGEAGSTAAFALARAHANHLGGGSEW